MRMTPQELVGTVGWALPGIMWRLEAIEEQGHDPMAAPARGELCLKGPTLFEGYSP